MAKVSREFQVFVKPIGALCNLRCSYCYYLSKEGLYPEDKTFRMSDDLLERYIVQHIEAASEPVIRFSWHGGEPTLLGLDFFRKVVALQRKHQPAGQRIANGIQTNGLLLDEAWCDFLAKQGFAVGLSLDGPERMHDRYRRSKNGQPTHERVIHAYRLLQRYRIPTDILCVVNAFNVHYPLEVYRFFKELEVPYLTFLPLVERVPEGENGVSDRTVPADAWGEFLCAIFDEWVSRDIGRVKVQIFEEAARVAFGQEHSLCIFRETCGDIPVVEHNGDFYSCDHFVDEAHRLGNIREIPLSTLLESEEQRAFGRAKKDTLPHYCRRCEVRAMCHGGCPKNRFIETPDGEQGLNYLCPGYKRFFTHCHPFVEQVGAVWRAQRATFQAAPAPSKEVAREVGRNDPCPCGSGKKFKKCCLRKQRA